jgi:hypothetical protein
VDFANKLQEHQGYARRDAIEHAAAIRLRPILMTTAAMVVAMVPLLIARGAGAASRFDIGLVIAAGMVVGTLFTLFVTPAVYTYLARDHQAAKEKERAAEALATTPRGTNRGNVAEADAEAEAGMLFPGEPEPSQGALSPEALTVGSAGAESHRERRLTGRERRRRGLAPAAE